MSLAECIDEALEIVREDSELYSTVALDCNLLLALEHCRHKRLGRLSNGALAQVCVGAQEGDDLFVPFGVRLPIMFRPVDGDKGWYQVIGEAYVAAEFPDSVTTEIVIF